MLALLQQFPDESRRAERSTFQSETTAVTAPLICKSFKKGFRHTP
jgi:hypothetical protein